MGKKPELVPAATFPFSERPFHDGGYDDDGSYSGGYDRHCSRSTCVRHEAVRERSAPRAEDATATTSGGQVYGRVEAADGVYSGDLNTGGKRHGWGTLKTWGGDVFTGQFVDGLVHGYGEMAYADGSRHAGLWEKGERAGCGTYVGATGAAIRDGNWFDGKPAAYEIGVVDLDLIMAVTVVQRRFRRRSAARRDWGDDEFLS